MTLSRFVLIVFFAGVFDVLAVLLLVQLLSP